MAAELITPVDELTGIPLPIVPQNYLVEQSKLSNWHHAWHPNSDVALEDLGGRALRHSRIQLVRRIDHNYKDKGRPNYHNYYAGPEMPTTDSERFRLCVLSAAGYMPEMGIDLDGTSDGPLVRPLTTKERDLLRAPAQPHRLSSAERSRIERQASQDYRALRRSGSKKRFIDQTVSNIVRRREDQSSFGYHHVVYQYQPMRDFFRQQVLLQPATTMHQHQIEEMLLSPNPDRRAHLGVQLLLMLSREAADNVELDYKLLKRVDRLHPRMPDDASNLVFYKLGSRSERRELGAYKALQIGQALGIVA